MADLIPEPVWLKKADLVLLHDESLSLHGGASGIRDEGLLDSALTRAKNKFWYEQVDDIAALSASYAYGLAKNHAFVDGNKRAALLSIGLFLGLNGYRLKTTSVDAALTIEKMAAGVIDEPTLTEWIRKLMVKKP